MGALSCRTFEQAPTHYLLQDYSMCTTDLWVNMFMGKVDTIG